MVDEAVSTASDSDMGGIQADLQQNGINGATVSKPDPNRPEVIQITGVPADHVSDVSGILNSRYSTNYDITPGVNNTWTLTMKPTAVTQLKQNALDKAIDVIRQRVDSFGVKEPAIEPYQLGSYQILVELPGIDDLGRIRTSSSPRPASRPTRSWAAPGPTSRPPSKASAAPFLPMPNCSRACPARPARTVPLNGMS